MSEQRLAIRRIAGAERNTDARGDAVGLRRVAGDTQGFQNGLGQPACCCRACNAGHQNGELVASEPRHQLLRVEHRGDARSHGLKHRVARGVSEQVVHFLEAVEIEAEHGEAFALGEVGNFLVDPGVEMAAVGKRRQHVVMREIVDVLFGLLARLQIANGYDMMRPSGKHDRSQDQLDGRHRTVEMAQAGFDRLVRSGQQLGARGLVRKTGFEPGAGETGSGQAGQFGEARVDRDDLRLRRKPEALQRTHRRDRASGRLPSPSGGGRGCRAPRRPVPVR